MNIFLYKRNTITRIEKSTSKDTVWLPARTDPKRPNLDCLIIPDKRRGYTLQPITTKKKRKTKEKLKKENEKGNESHSKYKIKKELSGIILKTEKETPNGLKASFFKSFTPSKNGCKTPKRATFLGPTRSWTPPKSWRSHNVTKAIACNSNKENNKKERTDQSRTH